MILGKVCLRPHALYYVCVFICFIKFYILCVFVLYIMRNVCNVLYIFFFSIYVSLRSIEPLPWSKIISVFVVCSLSKTSDVWAHCWAAAKAWKEVISISSSIGGRSNFTHNNCGTSKSQWNLIRVSLLLYTLFNSLAVLWKAVFSWKKYILPFAATAYHNNFYSIDTFAANRNFISFYYFFVVICSMFILAYRARFRWAWAWDSELKLSK